MNEGEDGYKCGKDGGHGEARTAIVLGASWDGAEGRR